MTSTRALLVALAALAPAIAAAEVAPTGLRATLVYETGPAFIAQNDGRYGETGTPYEAADVGQRDTLLVSKRASLELGMGRHTLLLLYAPFDVTTEVELREDLQFRDELFPAGTVVRHRYLFDGYRASYLYRLFDARPVGLDLGGSFQIRSADVAFTEVAGGRRANQSDIGLVFALKARLWVRPCPTGAWGALEADGFSTFGLLDGVSGGIYDVQLVAGYPIGRGIDLTLGARLLGGGADVRDQAIENWANFIAFTAGARVQLDSLFR